MKFHTDPPPAARPQLVCKKMYGGEDFRLLMGCNTPESCQTQVSEITDSRLSEMQTVGFQQYKCWSGVCLYQGGKGLKGSGAKILFHIQSAGYKNLEYLAPRTFHRFEKSLSFAEMTLWPTTNKCGLFWPSCRKIWNNKSVGNRILIKFLIFCFFPDLLGGGRGEIGLKI